MRRIVWLDSVFERRPLRVVALGALGAALAWAIVTTNIMPHVAERAPGVALLLASDNPNVVFGVVDRKINPDSAAESAAIVAPPAMSRSARDRLRRRAQNALLRSPLDARGLRILGQLAPEESAADFMELAARHSLNEYRAHHWLLQKRLSEGRYAEALLSADIVLRTRPQLMPFIAPYLERMAEDRTASIALERMLARNPPWRERFLTHLPSIVSDVRAPLRLMLALKNTAHPAGVESQRRYFEFLFERRVYDFAYYAWRQLLPPERAQNEATLYNGDFAFPPSGSPFDWLLRSGAGARIDIASASEDSRALRIDYGPGRVAPHVAMQFIKLPAGAYRMAGRYRGEIAGRRGPRWRVACVNANGSIGESEMGMGRIRDWRHFEFEFIVPDKDCAMQSARLELDARSPSEWIVAGEISYADLKIEPIGEGAPSATVGGPSGAQ
ncbi:hypothetical protein [Methylosinus sp. RM1]|uniref:hypothetical protein n=1 Tax=Methylosinus sp. RM1 TaxID=2583817 RepID=UPI001408B3CA|nr:hypothetical protein [Methylosinus sp. RM1]